MINEVSASNTIALTWRVIILSDISNDSSIGVGIGAG